MFLRRVWTAASAILFLVGAAPAEAQDVGVNASCAYFTIQAAIDAASTQDGDVIYLDAGIHAPAAALTVDKDLTFVAADNGCTTEVPRNPAFGAVASISGSNLHRVATVGVGQLVFFRGLDLIDGEDFQGGILHVESGARVTLDDVRLSGGLATNDGGCLYVDNAVAYLENYSRLEDCQANLDGGGAALRNSAALYLSGSSICGDNTALRDGGGVHLEGGTLELNDSVIGGNQALGSAGAGILQGYGGGVYADGGAGVVIGEGSSLNVNQALSTWGTGGGVYLVGEESEDTTLILEDSFILDGAAERGGGVAVVGSATAYLRGDSTVERNEAVQGLAEGGGVYVGAPEGSGAVLVMEDESRVWMNDAARGGGIYLEGGSLVMTGTSGVGCVDCLWGTGLGNDATETGGGIYAEPYGSTRPSLVLDGEPWSYDEHGNVAGGIQIAKNWAKNSSGTSRDGGGGMALEEADLWASFVLIEDNEAGDDDGGSGGGVHLSDGSVFEGLNMLIVANTAASDGGGLFVEDSTLVLKSGFADCDPASIPAANHYCSEVRWNVADLGTGGGLALTGASVARVRSTAVLRNISHSTDGAAALFIDGTTVAEARTLLLAENATSGSLTVEVGSTASLTTRSSTFADERLSVVYRAGAGGLVKNSIFWDPVAGGGPGLVVEGVLEGRCNLGMGVGVLVGTGNDDGTDPLFVTDPVRGDYRLDPVSPAADACSTGPSRDLDGQARPLSPGTDYDRGAFEVDQWDPPRAGGA